MANKAKKKVELPPHPRDLAPLIDGLERKDLLLLIGCSDSLLIRDHRTLRDMGERRLIDFPYPQRNNYFDREQIEMLLLLRRSTIIKGRFHAIKDVIKYANREKT